MTLLELLHKTAAETPVIIEIQAPESQEEIGRIETTVQDLFDGTEIDGYKDREVEEISVLLENSPYPWLWIVIKETDEQASEIYLGE